MREDIDIIRHQITEDQLRAIAREHCTEEDDGTYVLVAVYWTREDLNGLDEYVDYLLHPNGSLTFNFDMRRTVRIGAYHHGFGWVPDPTVEQLNEFYTWLLEQPQTEDVFFVIEGGYDELDLEVEDFLSQLFE